MVDGIQGLGALPADVERDSVDVLVADSHKWLFGPEGSAIFYVREGARDRVPALASGWWNNKSAKSYLDYGFEPYDGARRYEPGTLPTDHLAGIAAAIELLEEMGRDAVRARILELVGALRSGLAARGWRIATPEPLASGILAAASISFEGPAHDREGAGAARRHRRAARRRRPLLPARRQRPRAGRARARRDRRAGLGLRRGSARGRGGPRPFDR